MNPIIIGTEHIQPPTSIVVNLAEYKKQKGAITEFRNPLADFMSGISYNELREIINNATVLGILYKTPGFIEALTATAATTEEEKAMAMDWQEKYLDKLDRDIGDMKSSLRATEERIAGMVNQTLSEMRDRDNQRHSEMRDRDNQRHTEILALRGDIQAIRTDNADTRRWIIGMVISAIAVSLAAIIGIVSVVTGN
jgi:hypothetical protein